MYIQLSPLLSGMVRESLKSSLRRSCCGEVRCEKEKNFCVDNFSELAQLLDFCSTRTWSPISPTVKSIKNHGSSSSVHVNVFKTEGKAAGSLEESIFSFSSFFIQLVGITFICRSARPREF